MPAATATRLGDGVAWNTTVEDGAILVSMCIRVAVEADVACANVGGVDVGLASDPLVVEGDTNSGAGRAAVG